MSEQVAVQRIQSWVANVRPQHALAELVEDNGVRDAIQSVEGRLVKLGPGARGRLEGGQAHGGLSTSQPRVRNGPATAEFESRSRRTPAWTPVNMSDPSTREDREFARERRGPKPNQRHFGHTSSRTASNRRTARNSQKSKNVRDMRSPACGAAVN
jgi:hypothetical protein